MEQLDKFAPAFAKAQAKMKNLPRNREVKVEPRNGGRSYTFTYTTLDKILDHVRPILAENGLSIIQMIDDLSVVTRVLHSSGQYIESRTTITPIKDKYGNVTAQAIGSAISYARRQSLLAILCLAPDDDDDANAADGNIADFSERGQRQRPASAQAQMKAPERPLSPDRQFIKDAVIQFRRSKTAASVTSLMTAYMQDKRWETLSKEQRDYIQKEAGNIAEGLPEVAGAA